jgi:GT2 family glycosyltransferase
MSRLPERIAVVIPTVVADELLDRCLQAVSAQVGVVVDVLLVQNGARVAAVCDRWERAGVNIVRPGENLGVAASWNFGCRWAWERGHHAVVLLNDDLVLLETSALGRFVEAVGSQARQLYFGVGCGFSCACVTRAVWGELGAFDEGFWPAYYEDNDMLARAKLAGVPWRDVELAAYHESSATIRLDAGMGALNGIAFPLNQRRYVAKWGGLPHRETFTTAWGGASPWPSVKDMLAAVAG